MMQRMLPLVLLASVLLAGCGNTITSIRETTTGWFSDKGKADEETRPTELDEDFTPTVQVQELWSERTGKGAEELYLKLLPADADGVVYTAEREGGVFALDAASGDEQWSEHDKGRMISGGPGVGDGKVFVGTSEAEVVARDAKTGKKLWIAKVSSEVLAPPRAAEGVVVIRTGDGNVYALDTATGLEKWVYDRSIPSLTLRGTAAPTIHDGVVYIGFDNGRLVALDLQTGEQVWEAQLAQPSGRSDLERLVDIDGEPVVTDDTVYIGSFQGRVAALSTDGGAIEWTRDMSTYDNVAVDDARVYITDERGVVWALDRYDGSAKWRNRDLRYRRLTGPTHFKGYIVVGDFEGYLHWMDDETGELVARCRVDKERILTPPLDLGESLLGYSSSGRIAAFRAD
ncbi:MAG: outer membrane protein assembly factor BamB [Gammaproteobacteria bacterium]